MSQAKRRTGPVDADAVIDAALDVVDREGLDALTMRRLAHDLGVEPVTIYRQLPNKEAILAGVAERLWAQLLPPEESSGPASDDRPGEPPAPAPIEIEAGGPPSRPDWRGQIRAMWLSLHRLMQDHPNAIPIVAKGGTYSGTAGGGTAAMAAVMRDAGLTPDEAGELMHIVAACVVGFGFATLWTREISQGRRPQEPAGETAAARRPADLQPYIKAMSEWDPAQFETALDLILDSYLRDDVVGRDRS